MPKQVDHEVRRAQIADAVGRLAAQSGLEGVSFRDVAAEAGMSVALVQHYFGTKQELLVGSLDIQSARLAEVILGRVGALGLRQSPLEEVQAVIRAFLPDDASSSTAMLLYHGFAAAALTDPDLRGGEAFQNEITLLAHLESLLRHGQATGFVRSGIDPALEARGLLSLVLGLSLGVLLDRTTVLDGEAILDAHIERLRNPVSRRQ